MAINWKLGPIENKVIGEIVDRAVLELDEVVGHSVDRMYLRMDLTACHLNGTRLNLVKLRDFPRFDFLHDIAGITRHMDRNTGRLTDHFVPRSIWRESDSAEAQERLLSAIFGGDR